MNTHFNETLPQNAANFEALTPIQFMERAAYNFPDNVATIQEGYHNQPTRSTTYREEYSKSRQLADALQQRGAQYGDCVAVLLPNVPAMLEAHHGIPMIGAVLLSLNTRLDPKTIAFALNHSEAKVLITDTEFSENVGAALKLVNNKEILVVDHDDAYSETPNTGSLLGSIEFSDFLKSGNPEFEWRFPRSEWDAIALNYTSGTTADPKGVVLHHRGAFLNAAGNTMSWAMPKKAVYLWTLPMFHCNGWCFPWSVCAVAGTHVCLRKVNAEAIFKAIADHTVTHMCGAPIVMQTLLNYNGPKTHSHKVQMMTAASAPPASMLEKMAELNFNITHVYGLTEVYGPAVVCEWHDEWNELDMEGQAAKNARQGVRYPMLEGLMVADAETMKAVPRDGQTIGEVMFRGNIVMKGYLKNPKTNAKEMANGWFHSGDLAVVHPDGYIMLKDRSKDIIISGGENISSLEIESVLHKHPFTLDVAVVATPDPKWGEVPAAFVTIGQADQNNDHLGSNWAGTPEQIAATLKAYCRENLPHYSVPKHYFVLSLEEMPKTSTGKITKNILREMAKKRITPAAKL